MTVILNAEGGAETQLFLDSRVRSHAELTHLGEQVAPLLFPAASGHTVVVDDNSQGYPFVKISAAKVYEPGPRPKFSLDTRLIVSFLLNDGFRSVDLGVQAPLVPVTATWVPLPVVALPAGLVAFSFLVAALVLRPARPLTAATPPHPTVDQ